MYGVTTDPIVCAHSHLLLTLRRGNQITIETESERERDCTQRFIKDKYTLFISIRATPLQRYLSAYNKDVASNKVATLRFVQLRIANWASEASPTLGCSIEISRERYIYMYVGMSVCLRFYG